MNGIVSSSSAVPCLVGQGVAASSANQTDGTAQALALQALELFEQWLVDGGDERIAINPESRRNRYGTPRGKACSEVWFSSSTANAISPRGYDAAFAAFHGLTSVGHVTSVAGWFDRIRARLTALFGIDGSEVVLSGSGTELELLALFLAQHALPHPLVNLVMAPGETGRGVLLAASGRHFLGSTPFNGTVERAAAIEGFADGLLTETVDIRDEHGQALPLDQIDEEVIRKVELGIAEGRSVLLHLLDCSKTSRCGPRRSTASALVKQYPGRVLVVVDGCQLRCAPDQIRADLRAGFLVMITGSKFAAGPPFAGALLLPPAIVQELRALDMPAGLAAYTAAEDWPVSLRQRIGQSFAEPHNIGVGLRWEAALAELERLFALPEAFRDAVAMAFADAIERRVSASPYLSLIDDAAMPNDHPCDRTIHSIVTCAGKAGDLSSETIHRELRLPCSDDSTRGVSKSVYHVGQPVQIGGRSVLRVCLSAAHIVDVAEHVTQGETFEAAIAPLLEDIAGLFHKWDRLAEQLSRG
jgi:hypothetical protein